MTAPTPPGYSPANATAREVLHAYALAIGTDLELALLTSTTMGPVLLTGKLADASVRAGDLTSITLAHAGGVLSVIPWHAVARVILRPTHPANT